MNLLPLFGSSLRGHARGSALAVALLVLAGCSSPPDESVLAAPTAENVIAPRPAGSEATERGTEPEPEIDPDPFVFDGEFKLADIEVGGTVSGPEPAAPAKEAPSAPDSPALAELVAAAPPAEVDADERQVMDEAAALACAEAEFALDAAFAADAAGLAEALAKARSWAQDTALTAIAAEIGALDADLDMADASNVVLGVLTTCSEAGYEL